MASSEPRCGAVGVRLLVSESAWSTAMGRWRRCATRGGAPQSLRQRVSARSLGAVRRAAVGRPSQDAHGKLVRCRSCLLHYRSPSSHGCAPMNPMATDQPAARIRALDETWKAAADRRDLDGMMAIYAPDAQELLPDMPPIVGREAIHFVPMQCRRESSWVCGGIGTEIGICR